MKQTCLRCGEDIPEPTEHHANYVRSDDFAVEEEKEVLEALYLTDELRALRDLLVEEEEMNIDQANAVIARNEEHYLRNEDRHFDVGEDKFEVVKVDEPISSAQDPDVACTRSRTVTETIVKNGLVCKDGCVEEDDLVIW